MKAKQMPRDKAGTDKGQTMDKDRLLLSPRDDLRRRSMHLQWTADD